VVTERGRVTIEQGVVVGTGGGRELRCDVFTPPGGTEAAPAVLLIHGGGWVSGDREQLRGFGVLLGREGFVCVTAEYRLTGEAPWPAQIHDVKAVLRWMRANAAQLRIDPTKIAIEGNSAGADLALFAAGTQNAPEWEGAGGNSGSGTEVSAVIAFYPPVLLGNSFDDPSGSVSASALLLDQTTANSAKEASPLSYARADFPPTLLLHGNADTVVPAAASFRMYEALQAAGAPVELHVYAEAPHGFDADPGFGRQSAQIMKLFLDRYVAGTRPLLAQVPPEMSGAATS
jgi:acetyl esterase/lipase